VRFPESRTSFAPYSATNIPHGKMMYVTNTEPTLDQLAGILRSCSQERADNSLANLLSATGGTIDLTLSGHGDHLRRWLNKWVRRLRYPLPGEPDIFTDSLLQWWPASGAALPSCAMAELTDTALIHRWPNFGTSGCTSPSRAAAQFPLPYVHCS